MKIVQVTPVYRPALRYGGPVVAVHDLCRALAARGHDVTVMTTDVDGTGHSDVPLDRPLHQDGVTIRYFPSPLLRRIFWSPALGRALDGAMRDADLVHLHMIFQWPVWAGARAARAAGLPYVVSPRGMLVADMVRRRNRLAKTLWLALIERSTVERAAALQVASELEAAELAGFGWRLPPIAVVANGVDDPDPAIAGRPLAPDIAAAIAARPVVLYLGRLSWKKGLDRLLRAFALTPSGTLVIAGTDDEGLSTRLAALAEQLNIAARVRIVPRTVDGADKEALFAAAQLFVLPSYSENFGNTVLEAMRRGVAVVTTPQVGAAAIVEAAQAGLIVDGESPSFAAAMQQLIDDPARAAIMGAAGRRHVVAHYGWPAMAARIEQLYLSLIL
ncbi:MAG: glycosyltransferase [Rhodopseudomonas sp.]|nr:glycosyltransferase [Rhodopseudomonas sp.]